MLRVQKHKKKSTEKADQYSLRDLLRELLNECGLKDVMINDRIYQSLKKKIWKIMQQGKKVKGGIQLKKFTDKLQREPFLLKIYVHETENARVVAENVFLKGKNFKLEEKLKEKAEENNKLKTDLSVANMKTNYWNKRFKNLVAQCIAENKKISTRKQNLKSFTDYSLRSQYRIKKKLEAECRSALEFTGLYDFVPSSVELFNPETQQYESLCLLDTDELKTIVPAEENMEHQKMDNVYLMLYVKEKFNISNMAWHEIAYNSRDLPSSYSLKKRVSALNEKWDIFPTPGGTEGVQIQFEKSLKEQALRLMGEGQIEIGQKLKVKLSGDGTRIGKRLQLLNVTYCIINEGYRAATEKGNYILAIIKTKDDYQGITDSFEDLRKEMASLKSVDVKENTFEIEYFLGGYWKFLATVCGVGPANQDYACIWCRCPRNLRHDTMKEWPMLDEEKGSRTIKSIQTNHGKGRKFNCQNKPLFDFIEIDHVVIDTLHLFLRICDVLIENLILRMKTEDAILKSVFSSGFDVTKYKHMKHYVDLLNSLGIPFSFATNKDSRKMEYRSLNDPEKLLLFDKIKIADVLPKFKNNISSATIIHG